MNRKDYVKISFVKDIIETNGKIVTNLLSYLNNFKFHGNSTTFTHIFAKIYSEG